MEDIKTKEEKKSEEKKELVDIEIMEPNEEKEKEEEEIIFDDNLKKHIEGKILILDDHYKLNLKILYNKTENELPIIIINDWKANNPNKCALVILDTDNTKAKLIEEYDISEKDSRWQEVRNRIFYDDNNYTVI